MEDSTATPRINFELMQRFVGRKVLLACSVTQIENGRVLAQTSDNGKVSIAAGQAPYEGQFIEVCGTVTGPDSIQEVSHTNLVDNYSKSAAEVGSRAPGWARGTAAAATLACVSRHAHVGGGASLASSVCLPMQTWRCTTSWSSSSTGSRTRATSCDGTFSPSKIFGARVLFLLAN